MELIMKKLLLISVLCNVLMAVSAQNKCVLVTQKKAIIYANAPANVNTKKTIRLIIHFPLKSDGTGNFTETKDCHGNVSDYNGYWFANKFIERANYCLQDNKEMTQQLSNRNIRNDDINIQFELAGVVFHRNDNLFCCKKELESGELTVANTTTLGIAANIVDQTTSEEAIHVFLYKDCDWGLGISQWSGNVCIVTGVDTVYDGYMQSRYDYLKDWWFEARIVRFSLHEIGHCLSLKHPKLSDDGKPCDSMDCDYDDGCIDTPSYQELIADGYEDPYAWNDAESSNNVMDYNASQAAWTPCQIEKVHENIAQRLYLYPTLFKRNSATITSNVSQENKVVIAKNVTAKNVTVPKDRALYINCDEFQTNGTFEVASGATLEIK